MKYFNNPLKLNGITSTLLLPFFMFTIVNMLIVKKTECNYGKILQSRETWKKARIIKCLNVKKFSEKENLKILWYLNTNG